MAIQKHVAFTSSGQSRIVLILGVIVLFISINFSYELLLSWGGFMRTKGPLWLRSGRADCNNYAKDKAVCDVGGFYRKGSSQSQEHLFSSWRKKNQTLSVQEIFSDEIFFRLEKHEVMTEDGKVIQSWMWTEVPDMINVLIRDVRGDYILLQQSKYGIEGESYAGKLQDVTAMRQM
mmetsp:Transcript_2460/g.5166  ORF Transcript_2460/g.5166 Transcript_2460/m.5166 type:complete len:176 (-) Transcript_2460:560-1087(-)